MLRAWINGGVYSRKRGIRKKPQIQNASGKAVYKAEFPRYVRYADTYIYEVRVCPATSAYRLKDTVYTFTLSTYAGFLTYTANFVIILRLELPRAMMPEEIREPESRSRLIMLAYYMKLPENCIGSLKSFNVEDYQMYFKQPCGNRFHSRSLSELGSINREKCRQSKLRNFGDALHCNSCENNWIIIK